MKFSALLIFTLICLLPCITSAGQEASVFCVGSAGMKDSDAPLGAVSEFENPQKTIEALKGTKFALVLKSNRTTGYGWQLSSPEADKVVRLAGNRYLESRTGLPGAAGEEVWTFEAVGRGRTQITLIYVRSWEKNVAPARTVTFRVNVK